MGSWAVLEWMDAGASGRLFRGNRGQAPVTRHVKLIRIGSVAMQLSAIVTRGYRTTLLVGSVVAFWAFVPKAGLGAVSYSDAVIKDGPVA